MNRTTPSAPPKARATPWRLILALGIAALAIALFWPATECGFLHFDDGSYVFENPHVNTGLSAANLRWAFTSVHENWWLPVLWISFMADTGLFGPGPFGYHLVNVLLHALNAALLFWILSRMTGSRWRSAFVAALFAFHPLRVESVAWITERKDVLSGFFFLLALLAYLRHAERPSPARFSWVALWMLLGLMSKAILIILPPVLLLLDFWPLRRAGDPFDRREWRNWGRLLLGKGPLILLAAAFVLLNLRTHLTGSAIYEAVPPAVRAGLVFPNYWSYAGKLLWPAHLAILYPEHDVVDWTVSLAALAGLAAVTVLLVRLRAKHPALLVGWLWFLVALFPVIRGLRLGYAAYADRFTYLPSIGLFLLFAWAVADLLLPEPRRIPFLAALALALLAACAGKVRATLPLWKNTLTVFENVLAQAPDYPLAHNNLGAYYASINRPGPARVHLQRCLQLQPGFADAHLNLANLCMAEGNLPDAVLHYRAVLESRPDSLKALNNLSWLLAETPGASPSQREESLRLALRATELSKSADASILDTLAVAYAANRRFGDAARTAEEALQRAQANGESSLAASVAKRLAAYRRGEPGRE